MLYRPLITHYHHITACDKLLVLLMLEFVGFLFHQQDIFYVISDDALRREVPVACRHPNQSMRDYLTTIYPEYLSTAPTELVSQFIDLYEHARHKPEVFRYDRINMFCCVLLNSINNLQPTS